MSTVRRQAIDAIRFLQSLPTHNAARRRCRNLRIAGQWKRVYLYHIRKSGGTSLKMAFLRLGGEDPDAVNKRLFASPVRRAISGDFVFQGHVKTMIERGNYYYGYSHRPAHEMTLPAETFAFTVFRHPVRRVISHYKMLVGMAEGGGPPMPRGESDLIVDGFDGFLDRLDRSHLLRQLFMFSKSFDVSEAVDFVHGLNAVYFVEDMSSAVSSLASALDIHLEIRHERKSPQNIEIPDDGVLRLQEMMQPEFAFFDALRGTLGDRFPVPDYAIKT